MTAVYQQLYISLESFGPNILFLASILDICMKELHILRRFLQWRRVNTLRLSSLPDKKYQYYKLTKVHEKFKFNYKSTDFTRHQISSQIPSGVSTLLSFFIYYFSNILEESIMNEIFIKNIHFYPFHSSWFAV